MVKSLRYGILTPIKLLNDPSCSWKNFNFLPLHTSYFDKNIALPLLVRKTLSFCLFQSFSYTLNNKIAFFHIWFKVLFVIRIFDFFLQIIKSFSTLFIKTNSSWPIFESVKALETKTSCDSIYILLKILPDPFFSCFFFNYFLFILFNSCCYSISF